MRRRDFIKVIAGSAVAWPRGGQAQQRAMPVIGFLSVASPDAYRPMAAAFRQALREAGFIDGQNITIEYRWAEQHVDRLPGLAADLVQRRVDVIAAVTTEAAVVAKAASRSIPIVFETGGDALQLGLVASLNRPGGNITGVSQLTGTLVSKEFEVLHELLPSVRTLAFLVNAGDPIIAENGVKEARTAADALGLNVPILEARSERDFDGVLEKVAELKAGGLVICPDPLFSGLSEQLGALSARRRVPAVYKQREFAAAGGLLSYGTSLAEAYRLVGLYTARVLKGERPAELPVQQATKIELYINLKTAKALGITIPLPLSGRADELFE